MAGTKDGGQAAAATNKKKYGPDFYKQIGAMGGKKGHTGGFTNNPELASRAGRIGGLLSRRGKSKDPAHLARLLSEHEAKKKLREAEALRSRARRLATNEQKLKERLAEIQIERDRTLQEVGRMLRTEA